MSQKDTLKLLLPSADDYDDATLDSFIEIAQGRVSESAFGDQYDYAVALMACHIIMLSKRDGSAGQVAGVKEGQLSINYSAVSSDASLDHTTCGAEFKQLRRSLVVGARSRLV
jgi:hypothetical protein